MFLSVEEVEKFEKLNEANISRLNRLAKDADAKRREAVSENRIATANYWNGFRDGLLRAIGVLEGRG